jgi:uncharacterized membrane protein
VEYIIKAAGVWFVGFFPLAEIYVAVPAGMAAGLDSASVVVWSVLGNFTPAVLIHFFYDQLNRVERIRRWLSKFTSEKLRDRVNRYGTWILLILTPWTGIWIMAVTAKVLGMDGRRLLIYTFISISIYAVVLAALIALGVDFISGGSETTT